MFKKGSYSIIRKTKFSNIVTCNLKFRKDFCLQGLADLNLGTTLRWRNICNQLNIKQKINEILIVFYKFVTGLNKSFPDLMIRACKYQEYFEHIG